MRKKQFKHNLIWGALLLTGFSQAQASGFALIEQSASGQGLSYAGAAANTEDASSMWFNPAGMTQLKGHEVIVGAHVIMPHAPFRNEGSTVLTPPMPLTGKEENGARTGVVPNLYWKGKIGAYDVGLGVNVPFGSTVDYEQDWIGRYHAVYSETKTININPSIARKVTPNLSIGAGISAQYVSVRLTQKIDFGLSSTPQTNDGYADLEASGWGFGYNLGLLYQFKNESQLGLAYRSQVTHNPTGTADFTTPANITDAQYQDTHIKSHIDLPATVSLSYVYPSSPKLSWLADATWTGWSSFKELRVKFSNPLKSDSTQPEEWRDVMRYSLGAIYQYTPKLKFRSGIAFDETPIKNKTLRTPRIADSNREWLSVGLGYQWRKNLNLDLAYSHLWGGKPDIEALDSDTKQHLLKGHFDINIDIVSAQLVWKY